MARWLLPVDPECPVVREYERRLFGDPMSKGAPTDEIMDAFRRRHQQECERCLEYGLENIEVE